MSVFSKILDFVRKSDEDINRIPEYLDIEVNKDSINKPEDTDLFDTKSLTNLIRLLKREDEITNKDDENKYNINEFTDITALYKNVTIPKERINYYKQLEELYKTFPIARRIENQYISSICKVDPITNRIIIQKENDNLSEIYHKLINVVKQKQKLVITYYDIEDKIKTRILPKTLRYGNFYVEILDKNEFLNIDQYIEETEESSKRDEYIKQKLGLIQRYLTENNEINEDIFPHLSDLLIDVEYPASSNYSYNDIVRNSQLTLLESAQQEKENSSQEFVLRLYENITRDKLSHIEIRLYDPKYILPIHNEQKIIGYLVFQSNEEENVYMNYDITKYLSQLFNKSSKGEKDFKKFEKEQYKKFINYIISKLYDKFRDEIDKAENKDEKVKIILSQLYKLDKQIFLILRDIFVEKKIYSVKVRFVPADRMINFLVDPQDWPYGQSILEPLIFYSKLYMLTLLSNVITKLSRASVIRKWILDVGIAKQQANLVEQLKRELTNKIITIDSVGSLQAIPRILTDYKDLITIQKNGRSFVDFTVQQTGDPSVDIQDLDFLKNEIISLSKIPSPYLGMVDTVELREQLVTANIIWAEIISNYQQQLSEKINELIDKIFILINKNELSQQNNTDILLPSDIVKLHLNQPVILQIQYLDAVFASLSNTIQILSSTPDGQKKFDLMKLLKKFIPTIDWDEFSKDENNYKTADMEKIGNQEPMQPGGGF